MKSANDQLELQHVVLFKAENDHGRFQEHIRNPAIDNICVTDRAAVSGRI